MTHRRTLLKAALAGAGTAALPRAFAQADDWPKQTVRIIVPFSAGGASDVLTRLIAERLQGKFGQQFVVENRTGAGGNIGMEAVQKAAPDGYTIASATIGTLSINEFLFAKMPYDAAKDFAYVSTIWENTNVMVVNAGHPAKNLQEFLAWAKAQPQGVTFSSSGVGTTPHLSGELFRLKTGIKALHIPFRGAAQSMPEVISGNVNFAIDNIASWNPMLKAGKARALAVTSDYRWPTDHARGADHGRGRCSRLRRYLLGRLRDAGRHAGGNCQQGIGSGPRVCRRPGAATAFFGHRRALGRLVTAGDLCLRRA